MFQLKFRQKPSKIRLLCIKYLNAPEKKKARNIGSPASAAYDSDRIKLIITLQYRHCSTVVLTTNNTTSQTQRHVFKCLNFDLQMLFNVPDHKGQILKSK